MGVVGGRRLVKKRRLEKMSGMQFLAFFGGRNPILVARLRMVWRNADYRLQSR